MTRQTIFITTLLLLLHAGWGADNTVVLGKLSVSFPATYTIYHHNPFAIFGGSITVIPGDKDGAARDDKATVTYVYVDLANHAGLTFIQSFEANSAPAITAGEKGWSVKQSITPYKEKLALQADALLVDGGRKSAYMMTIRKIVDDEDEFLAPDDAFLLQCLAMAKFLPPGA